MQKLSVTLALALLASLVFSAAAAGGRLLQGSSTSSGSSTGYPFVWPTYLANPYKSPGSASCSDAFVGGFPASYWAVQGKMPKPFTIPYRDPPSCEAHAAKTGMAANAAHFQESCVGAEAACSNACVKETCMDAYQFDVKTVNISFGLWDNLHADCKTGTQLMGYGGIVPACTVEATVGRQVLLRMINKIEYPAAAMPKEQNIHPCNGYSEKTKSIRRGRPFSVHHHGSASLAPYDGWASDEVCYGEIKDYVYPGNRAGTGWYHDHALDITAANAYWGMAGQFVVQDKKIETDWNLVGMERRHLILSDKVFDDKCQLVKDETKYHKENLYGDVNLVSGIPWPLDETFPAWHRFHVLSAGISRPYHLKLMGVKDGAQKLDDVNLALPGTCYIIAGDGGYRKSPIPFPASGLFMGVAERYEFVCDFEALKKAGYSELYLYNVQDPNRMKEVPFFCLSHLLMKFLINKPVPPSFVNPNFKATLPSIKYNTVVENVLTPADIQDSTTRAKSGSFDRYFKFERSNGQWVINGETWFTHRVAADDVGTNTYEIWKLETGGGWFHPIHIHLVDFYVLHRTSGSYPYLETYEQDVPKDVVMLYPGAQVYILARFGAHKGEYMFHCHNLIHEDMAMLRSFNESTYNANKFSKEKGALGAVFNMITKAEYNADRPFDVSERGIKTLYDTYWQADLCDHAYAAPATDPKWKVGPDGGLTKAFVNEQILEGRYRLFYPLREDPDALCDPNTNKWLINKPCNAV